MRLASMNISSSTFQKMVVARDSLVKLFIDQLAEKILNLRAGSGELKLIALKITNSSGTNLDLPPRIGGQNYGWFCSICTGRQFKIMAVGKLGLG